MDVSARNFIRAKIYTNKVDPTVSGTIPLFPGIYSLHIQVSHSLRTAVVSESLDGEGVNFLALPTSAKLQASGMSLFFF